IARTLIMRLAQSNYLVQDRRGNRESSNVHRASSARLGTSCYRSGKGVLRRKMQTRCRQRQTYMTSWLRPSHLHISPEDRTARDGRKARSALPAWHVHVAPAALGQGTAAYSSPQRWQVLRYPRKPYSPYQAHVLCREPRQSRCPTQG